MQKKLVNVMVSIVLVLGIGFYYYPSKSEAISTSHIWISQASGGGYASGQSYYGETSQDGRYTKYESRAADILSGDSNNAEDVFLHDNTLNTTVLVSKNTSGGFSNGQSLESHMTSNGKYIVYSSSNHSLITSYPGATNQFDIYLYTVATGTNELVSINSTGTIGNSSSSVPDVSNDGRFIVFMSNSSVFGGTNFKYHVYMRDRTLGTTTQLSKTSGGIEGNYSSRNPRISCSGRYVTIQTEASNLATNVSTSYGAIVLLDLSNGARIFTAITPNANNNVNGRPNSISCDGNYIAYSADASNLVASDTNGTMDIFRYNVADGITQRVSVDSSNQQVDNNGSYDPVLSGDGNLVVFSGSDPVSSGTPLVTGDNNTKVDVFMRNMTAGTTDIVSINGSSTLGNDHSDTASINASGTVMTYSTSATNLFSGDTSFWPDIVTTSTQLSPVCNY